ncbi:MAG: sigma-54-dependent Fis family transcriptional regulator [Bradymonadales bacterium]|nr:MAG: sigma-54-dependent Fis family transcriptional regulator [Bradymonadales bacterium]
MSKPKLLIVDDEEIFQLSMRAFLRDHFEVKFAGNGDDALTLVKSQRFQIILLDVRMRTQTEGLEYIPQLREADPEIPIVMASGLRDFDVIREAMRLGAIDYIPKDSEPEDLLHSLKRVLEMQQLVEKNEQAQAETKKQHQGKSLIGTHPKIEQLRRMIEKVKNSWVNVVITGETGTGKEVVARSLRPTDAKGNLQPFVAIDSSTIQSTVAESLLFGHEKGAFTGATEFRKGAFEEANGGVIYFDEIANMPLEIQAKLLRVIQEKEITRLGSSRVIPLEFQVVCATNKNLLDLVKEGKFKEDLYQRLNVVPLFVPPLRERMQDFAELVDFFCEKHASGEKRISFTDEAMATMKSYRWPGNVRELSNMIAYLTAVIDGHVVDTEDLPAQILGEQLESDWEPVEDSGNRKLYERVAAFERKILVDEYQRCEGNISKLAAELGMDRSHLYTKLKVYKIHKATKASRLAEQCSDRTAGAST